MSPLPTVLFRKVNCLLGRGAPPVASSGPALMGLCPYAGCTTSGGISRGQSGRGKITSLDLLTTGFFMKSKMKLGF